MSHLNRSSLALLVCLAVASCSSRGATRPGGETSDSGPQSFADGARPRPSTDAGPLDPDAACEAVRVRSQPGIANVLIVLDRSSSMYREAGLGVQGVDRWNPAVRAIQSVTAQLTDRVRFGLMLYANPDAPAGQTLCGAGKVDVAPATGTATAIRAELTGDPNTLTGSWTPTAVSLDAARTALAGLEGRSYVLLVTDGAPNCNQALNGATCRCGSDTMSCSSNPRLCIDSDRSVQAVEALATAGIPTYVVGYETSAWADVLDRMAAAGATGRTTHFPVADEQSLAGSLSEIAGGVVSCALDLEQVESIRYIRMTLDGVEVRHESVATDSARWRLVGDRTVELLGAACDTLRDGATHDLLVVRECAPVLL